MEIAWKAPAKIYKELNSLVDKIEKLIEKRKSKNLSNIFTTNKKLNAEFNKDLKPLIEKISKLYSVYSKDTTFGTTCSDLQEKLVSYKKKFGITTFIENKCGNTQIYRKIQKNLDEAEKINNSIKEDIAKKRKEIPEKTECSKCLENNKTYLNTSKSNFKSYYDTAYNFLNKNGTEYFPIKEDMEKIKEFTKLYRDVANAFEELGKKINEYENKLKSYNQPEIIDSLAKKINEFSKTTCKFDKLIEQSARNCRGLLEWDDCEKISQETLNLICATNNQFRNEFKNLQIEDAKSKDMLDLRNKMRKIRNNIHTELIINLRKKRIPENLLNKWQASLENRKICKDLYVFDTSNPKQSPQCVFDIVFAGKNIEEKINWIHSHNWILCDKNKNPKNIKGINNPNIPDLAEKLREVFGSK